MSTINAKNEKINIACVINTEPKIKYWVEILKLSVKINDGKKDQKNNETFGFNTFIIKPLMKNLELGLIDS